MNAHERDIIRQVKPLVDAGDRGRLYRVYQNLTTVRRRAMKCLQCDGPILKRAGRAFYGKAKFDTSLCSQIYRRTERMKKLIVATAALLVAFVGLSADLFVFWTNGDNGTNATQTVIVYGTTPNVYFAQTNVPFAQTNVWLAGLTGNQRYYVAAFHTDGTTNSVNSNEANAKTRMHSPKNLAIPQ